jgi:hypothetical protein
MAMDTPAILTAHFESLPSSFGHGWIMRISGTARKIEYTSTPFLARVGKIKVEALTWNFTGDRFVGYLRKIPNSGDRLFVGYGAANQPTTITFNPNSAGPAVA